MTFNRGQSQQIATSRDQPWFQPVIETAGFVDRDFI